MQLDCSDTYAFERFGDEPSLGDHSQAFAQAWNFGTKVR
jgi:hypothetical protein